jgi:hypothetical protein
VSQDQIKKLKKGEVLFKENDPCPNVYVIQSGKISMTLDRGGKKSEIGVLGPYQILGEQAVISNGRHLCGAEAMQETKVVEMSVDQLKPLYEKAPANFKLFIRGLLEEAKQARITMRTARMENDKSPCPQMAIPRIFTLTHLLSRHIGKRDPANPDIVTVSWTSLKTSATRFFNEPTQRLRQLMDLLLKLKVATFEVKTSEEGEEELQNLTLTKLQSLEDFAEFYQYHLFKGQKAEAIYVDTLALKAAKALVEFSEGAPVDHKNASTVDYNEVLQKYKEKFKQDLKTTHLDALEKKGLYVQRKSHDNGKFDIIFDRTEFSKMSFFWSIIAEIDKWNEKGFVDINEKEEVVAPDGVGCPQCSGVIAENNKFCPNCGFKLQAA